MKKITNVANFDGRYVTIDDGSTYVRFDFGGFYEWYEVADKKFSLIDVASSNELEESFHEFESSSEPKIIHLGEIRSKSKGASNA